jgi:YHS domain-containing protein
MTDCCESSCNPPRKFRCPVNGKEYGSVSVKTILHHINEPWKSVLESKAYYFCSDAKCDVVYFGQDNSVIKKNELRSKVGIKQNIPGRTICYCFGVSYSAAKENNTIVNFVKDKTKQALCSCETSNPSGQCCLKDFPKQ